MYPSIALLVSHCPFVVEQVKGITRGLPHLQVEACSAQAACDRAVQPDVGLILAHLDESGDVGTTKLLRSVAQARRCCPTVVLCDSLQEVVARDLLRAGAANYVTVPAELTRLGFLLDALTQRLRATSAQPVVRPAPATGLVEDGLHLLTEQVRRVAPQETTVLLTGETGTGKTRLARLIHELSPRRDQPFLVVDCGALSAELIESELFGHSKGAFTGADRERPGKLAAAGTGTLLLDEINSLPLALQSKLLRAVDERVFTPVGSDKPRPARARLIAASNAPLEQEVAAGRFRADLYYRLNVVGFLLPLLRERRQAIVPLALRFLHDFASRNRPDVLGLSPEALEALTRYDWPGNVREVCNAVTGAAALCVGPEVGFEDLPEAIRRGRAKSPSSTTATAPTTGAIVQVSGPLTLALSKQEAEVRLIMETLERHDNNRVATAAELGISRVGLYKKMHKYRLMTPRYDKRAPSELATRDLFQDVPLTDIPDAPATRAHDEDGCLPLALHP